MNLEAIEARLDKEIAVARENGWKLQPDQEHRIALLSEVKRLSNSLFSPEAYHAAVQRAETAEAEVKRLKALCGRAAEQITLGWADFGTDDGCECEDCSAVRKANNLAAELKEASE